MKQENGDTFTYADLETATRFIRALILLHPDGNIDTEQIEAELANLGADDCGLRDPSQMKKHVGDVYAIFLKMPGLQQMEILEALKADGGLEKVKEEIEIMRAMNQSSFHPRTSFQSN